MPAFEVKTLPIAAARLELKRGRDGPARLSGYASAFGGQQPDSAGDYIKAGAYSRTIADWSASDRPLPMLFSHDVSRPIGIWPSLVEDGFGLKAEGELTPGVPDADAAEALIRHRALTGLSIGFRPRKASSGPKGTRILEDIELFEVSPCVHPANDRARVTGIKAAGEIADIRDFEGLLREVGFSKRDARLIAEKGFRAFLAGPADQLDDDDLANLLSDLRQLHSAVKGNPK